MNILLLVSTIFCVLLLLFIAYAFINNSELKLVNEPSTSGTSSEIDTSDNETANETETQ
jgi:biopolymer transport protein ExbD